MSSTEQSAPNGKSRQERLRYWLHQIVAILVSLLVFVAMFTGFYFLGLDKLVEQIEWKSYDFRTQMQMGDNPNRRPSNDIAIIQFDDSSLNALSEDFGLWPWPRDVHARMIHYLNQIGVKTLIYDVMFIAHRKGGEHEDAAFIRTFQKHRNVYLSMNLDHELVQSQKLGKDLTPRDIELLRPLSIEVNNQLAQAPKDTPLRLMHDPDGTIFFNNPEMTFNHYRGIMRELLATGRNVGVINHGIDDDGVSRANPLIFRFQYEDFIKSDALPIIAKNGKFYDQQGNRTDEQGYRYQRQVKGSPLETHAVSFDAEGYAQDEFGQPVYMRRPGLNTLYFPYLGLRVWLDREYHGKLPIITITPQGHLTFGKREIPLLPNGSCLATWYNISLTREQQESAKQQLSQIADMLKRQVSELSSQIESGKLSASQIKTLRKELQVQQDELKKADAAIEMINQWLRKKFSPQPYPMIPAWQVVNAMRRAEQHRPPTADDKALMASLEGKTIFLGATAVAAYDIKNTSIDSQLPGVVLQATLFDNISRADDRHFVQRASLEVNFWVALIFCALAIVANLRIKSPLVALLTTANLMIFEMVLAISIYQWLNLWIDIAIPLVCILVMTLLAYMAKYMLRDKEYEKTYALATTDSMTGLYNHRYFQDALRRSIEQSNRYNHPFSLLLIDIDFFKKFNDTHGHQAGDAVLKHVAAKLRKTVRAIDVVARYGGEEMAIIVARAGQEEAVAVAQKVVEAIAEEAYPIAEGVSKHVTISCGVSVYPKHGLTPAELIEVSDGGLYRAKENGRNQVGALPPEGNQTEVQEPVSH